MKTAKKELNAVVNQIADVKAVYSTKIPAKDRPQITNPRIGADIFRSVYNRNGDMEQKESFHALFLTRSNSVLGTAKISEGSATATVVDTHYLLRIALLINAQGIIVCHNHPSGNINPSQTDKKLTEDLKKACEFLNITLIDHLILTAEDFCSFANEGLL